MQTEIPKLLTVAEAARRAPGCPTERTVWRWIERGAQGRKLHVLRTPGRTYVAESELRAFIEFLSSKGEE